MATPNPDPDDVELTRRASVRLVRAVDAWRDDEWTAPSLLPAWTRAHVVAHLLLNAEGLAAALHGLVAGEPAPMYASQERRDGDIDELAAGARPAELRERLLASVTVLADAIAAVPPDSSATEVERVPGGRTFPAGAVPRMRLLEVEIHHADLGAGYSPADWLDGVATRVLDARTAAADGSRSFGLRATDLDRTWTVGAGGPTVSGTAADLAWWLTGRGDGAGLTSDDGELPDMGAW